ncbi:hypothetical protein Tco_1207045, partial [Tanacetum coccineum]
MVLKFIRVLQRTALFDSLIVRKNVGFLLYECSRMPDDQIQQLVAETLAAVGLKVNYVDSGKNNKGCDKKRKGTWNSSKDNKKDKKPLSEVACYKCGEK